MNTPCAPGSKPTKRLDSKDFTTPPNPGVRPPKASASPHTLRACEPRVPATSAMLRRAGQSTAYAIISPSTQATSATRPCAVSCRRVVGSINASPKLCPATLQAPRKKSPGGSNGRHHPHPANGAPHRSLLDRGVARYQCTLRPTWVVSQRRTSPSPHPSQASKRHAGRRLTSPAPALLLETSRAGHVQDLSGIPPPAPPAVP